MKKRTFAWRVCNSFVWTLHGIFSDYVGPYQPPPSVEKEAVGGGARRKIPSETSWSRDEGCFDRGKAYSNYCARGNSFERGKQKTFITAVFRWLGEQVEQDFRVIPAAPCRLLLVPTRIFIRNGLSGAYPTRPLPRLFFTFSLLFFIFIFFSNAVLRFDNLINGHVLLETRVCAKPTEEGDKNEPTNERTGTKKAKRNLLSRQKVHESALGRIPKGKRRERVSRRSFEAERAFVFRFKQTPPSMIN